MVKCTFCSHIWKRERDKQLARGVTDINQVTYTPACASACPTGAIKFGDLRDPNSPVYEPRLKSDPRAVRLVQSIDRKDPAEAARRMAIKNYTNPKVYYLTSKEWLRNILNGFQNS